MTAPHSLSAHSLIPLRRSLPLALLAGLAALLLFSASAAAHAQLLSTSPERGASLSTSPEAVEFRFSEAVEAAFGAVRVYDGAGERVDDGELIRPDGEQSIGVGLPASLPAGVYTATYRVVSADSHPVAGGITFSVGQPTRAPVKSVSEYLEASRTPPLTNFAYGIVRFAGYAALCLLFGVAFFAAFIFTPALQQFDSRGAAEAFAQRAGRIEAVGLAAGVISAALAIVFQAAVATGESFFAALNPDAISEVLGTRSGGWMLARLLLWLAACGVWLLWRRRESRQHAIQLLALGLLVAQTPGLIGHAAVTQPAWLLVPVDLLHVLAMTLWVGGILASVLALPKATARLGRSSRTRLLTAIFDRFSLMAMIAVGVLALSGVIQVLVQIETPRELIDTAWGRTVLLKIGALVLALAAAALNRQKALPGLRIAAAQDSPPGQAGRLLRRALITETVFTAVAVALAAALVGFAPPSAAGQGIFVAERQLGPAQLQLVIDPAKPGANQVHLYLTDAAGGRQFTDFKDLKVTITRRQPQLGPIELAVKTAGPGHFVDQHAQFLGGGEWDVRVMMRRSEFEQDEQTFQLKLR